MLLTDHARIVGLGGCGCAAGATIEALDLPKQRHCFCLVPLTNSDTGETISRF